jgi:hypothetical protein
VLHHPRVTTLSWVGIGLMAVCLSRVSSSSFVGCDVEEVRELVAQCYGMKLAIPHNTRTKLGMAVQCRLVEQCQDMIPRRCQKIDVAGIHH